MRARRLLAIAAVTAALPLAAHATLYKWVDENGVVNYGDTPPATAKNPTQLDAATSSLSVVPGLSQEELARMRERADQARVERLEREVEELRARAATPPAPPPAPAYDSSHVTYVPVYPLHARRRPPHRHRDEPVRGRPVQKTPPFAGMKLER